MANNNGAYQDYPDYTPKATFFRSSPRNTKQVTVKSGQVIKALSFVQTDSEGKAITAANIAESAVVAFTDLTAGQTLIMAGLTYTDDGSGTTAEELVALYAGLEDGYVGTGDFSGTLAGYSIEAFNDTSVVFNSTTADASATDVANTGTGTVTITIKQGTTTPVGVLAGVTVYDVDASGGDVDASVYTEASFWADALVWAVDTSVDTIDLPDGTALAVTAYNTGAHGNKLLQQKFVEGSEYDPLGYSNDGEVY